jgi:hypothetical protein
MLENVRVGREHHVHIEVIAVDADGLGRGRKIIRGRLPFFLRTVLGIRLDVITEQIEQRHRKILARCDRAPSAHRMHAHRDAVLRHQVGILAAVNRQVLHASRGIRDLNLMNLLLGRERFVVNEIDREIEELLLRRFRQHVLDRADNAFRLQIAAAQPVRARIHRRHVARLAVSRMIRIGNVSVGKRAILHTAADRRTELADQRQVRGERLIHALQHRNTLAALENRAQQIAGERPEHRQFTTPTLILRVSRR